MKYTIRLKASDTFTLMKIFNRIGVQDVRKIITGSAGAKALIDNAKESETEIDTQAVGLEIMFDLAGLVFDRLPECENDIYKLIASVTGIGEDAVAELPIDEFFELIVNIFKDKAFTDFFTVVLKRAK